MPRATSNVLKLGMPRDKWFGVGLLASALQGISAVALLATSGYLISRAAEQPPVLYLMMAVVLVRGFALGRAAFRYLERVALHQATLAKQAKLRPLVYQSLIAFSGLNTNDESNAKTVSALVDDVDELQNLPTRVLSPVVQSTAVGVLAVIAACMVLPTAGLIMILAVLFAGFAVVPLVSRISTNSSRQLAVARTEFAAASYSLIANHELLAAYDWLEHERFTVSKHEQRLIDIQRKFALAAGLGQSLLAAASTVTVVVTAWLAANAVIDGQLTGVLLAALALLPLAVFEVLQGLLPVVSSWQRYRTSAERTLDLLERNLPNELQVGHGVELVNEFRSLEFKNIAAKYPGVKTTAIQPISFKLIAKKSLALVGDSGTGKSTIAKILIGHLNPSAGEYLINSLAAQNFAAESKRATIGYLEQSAIVLLGTVRDNLLIANPTATDQKLIEVLERVGLWQMFEAREGLSTWLGERASLISGGEAQRLAMARALLADFKVLILDEPTANVHPELADQLIQELISLAKQNGRAVILITHQKRYTKLCDQVLDLNKIA